MQFRPSKWILYSPVAVLPWLAAVVVGGNSVPDDLTNRTSEALKGAGADWATITITGRQAVITGDAKDAESIDQAVKAVAGTYGVRMVNTAAKVVEPPPLPELTAPTINNISAEAGKLEVSGTWQEGTATTLKASLADKSWTLGSDPAFTSDGKGNWVLKPALDLAPGTYDLALEATDPNGRSIKDTSKNEITVTAPLPPPPEITPPTVTSVETNSATPEIRGTWPSAVAKTLTVTVGPTVYELGKAKELTTEEDNWRLVPSLPLPDGEFDVTVEAGDGAGNSAKSAEPGHVMVDTKAPDAPTFATVSADKQPFTVTGKWPEGDAVSLVMKLAGKVWTLGTDKALASDGKGTWSFTPDVTLDPGTYDLEVEIKDRAGNVSRDATKDEIVIAAPSPPPPPPPPEMKAPTVFPATGMIARPVVKGTWTETAAKSLTVSLAGNAYTLGTDEALTSDGLGNWSLAVPKPLTDGVYDVAVETKNAAGNAAKDDTSNELTVDAAGPGTPTVSLYAGETSPSKITGHWDEANAASLKVSVPKAEIAATLGTDAALSSSGGNWSLELGRVLEPGSYDVVVETADAQMRLASDQTKFEVLVKEPPPPPPPPELKAPTVAVYAGDSSPKTITGTWDEGNATALSLAIPGATISAVLGTDQTLSSDGKGNWSLSLPSELAPGTYDVAVTEATSDGRTASDSTTAEIYIKAPPPPPPPPPPELKAPTVAVYGGEASPQTVGGTWDENNATALSVAIPGAKISAVLGTDQTLASDGKGNWSLSLPTALTPGTYDVAVISAASDGRTASDGTTAEIYIKAPPPPPPPPPPPAYDCEATLAKINTVFPIRFEYDKWDLHSPYDLSVNQVAALMKDPRCVDLKIEVIGHTDFIGGTLYNKSLSIKRAQNVVDTLVLGGVDAARFVVEGMGKAEPLDPARTDEARAKNRRVNLTIVK